MPVRAGRADAAAVVWDQEEDREKRDPGRRATRARIVGSLQGVALLLFSWLVLRRWSPVVSWIVLGLGVSILASALVSPTGLYESIGRLLRALGLVTGRILTWVLLVPTFYLFFLPYGRLARGGRRDRLRRWFEPEATSYWELRDGATVASPSRRAQY